MSPRFICELGKNPQNTPNPYLHTGPCILINVLFGGNVFRGFENGAKLGGFCSTLERRIEIYLKNPKKCTCSFRVFRQNRGLYWTFEPKTPLWWCLLAKIMVFFGRAGHFPRTGKLGETLGGFWERFSLERMSEHQTRFDSITDLMDPATPFRTRT